MKIIFKCEENIIYDSCYNILEVGFGLTQKIGLLDLEKLIFKRPKFIWFFEKTIFKNPRLLVF